MNKKPNVFTNQDSQNNTEALNNLNKIPNAMLSSMFYTTPESIVVFDTKGTLLFYNESFKKQIKAFPEKFEPNEFNLFTTNFCKNSSFAELIRPAFNGISCREHNYEYVFSSTPKKHAYFNVKAFPLKDDENDNEMLGVVLILENVTERVEAEKKIHTLAFYDQLTGLPNRQQIFEKLEQRLSYARRYNSFDALMIVNIDRFKIINEIYGNTTGDDIIVQMSKIIQSTIRDIDFLGRVGADEFAIILPCDAKNLEINSSSMLSTAERIRKNTKESMLALNNILNFTSSIGITFYPEDTLSLCTLGARGLISIENKGELEQQCDTAQDVFQRANSALLRAKEAGGNRTSFFEYTMELNARERYQIERDLTDASLQSQFELYLQPQVNKQSEVVGAECLIRWHHPSKGLLSPARFIPIAERTNLIITIGEWVLRKACSLLQTHFNNNPDFTLSINISPVHFSQPNFESWIIELLSFYSISPSRLMLEITEGILLENEKEIIEKMMRLFKLGFRFSIDDFGTGYSSLAYLKRLPLSEIKIDKSFIQDAPFDLNDAILVETIIAVAYKMGLNLVAEGVESQEQLDFLEAHKNIFYQGYYFGKPVPLNNFLEVYSDKIV